MAIDVKTLSVAKKYVKDTSDSLGSLKGAPCTIKSITKVEGGQKVTFEWTGTSGTKQTSEMTVKDGISVTGVSDKGNGVFTLLLSDGSESDPIQTVKGQKGDKGDKGDKLTFNDLSDEEKDSLKGSDGFSPSAKIEKVGDTATITITDKDGTTTATIKDSQGGSGGSGEENTIDSISVNGVNVVPDVNKNVNITVPEAYDDTDIRAELANKADTDHTHTTVNGHTVESDVPVDAKFTDTVYDDTQVKTQIQAVANGLMDSVGYSADYKTIDIIAKNGVKKSVNVAPIISHASITELSDVDTTNKATGKALVYNATTSKHEYADVSGTDEKVKMDASTDTKYLGELLDNVTIANENGELKVKKLDGQEVTITEINYLKGLTMNVMDLVNMFSNGGVKIINTPVATYAELLNLDKSSFIEGISYLVYVLADENHDNAKTTYLVDKDSKTPTYFGFADSQRDFMTNPIDLATEITGKLGIANMDSDAIKALFTVDDTYKTETTTNNAFSTHGAKALYDELLLAIGNKANDSDLTAHKDDTDIHVSTTEKDTWNTVTSKASKSDLTSHTSNTNIHITTAERTKWNKVDNKVDKTAIVDNLTSTNTDKPLSANQGKVLKGEVDKKANANEVIKKTDIATTINSTSTASQVPSAKAVYNLAGNENRRGYVYNNPTYRGNKWNRVFRVNSSLSCDSGFLTVTVYSNGLCQIATFLMSKNFNRLNIKQINCGGYNGDKGQSRPIKVRIISAEVSAYSFLEIYVTGTANTNVVATYMPLHCDSVVVLNEEGSVPGGMFACEMTATHDTYENATYTSVLK